jgi:hypothetical protein
VCLPIPPPRHNKYYIIYILEAPPRFELGIKVLQTSALPLGYGAKPSLERKTGFEPATLALARRYSTTELFPQKWLGYLDSNQGMTESKSVALPLGYNPINYMGRSMGIEPTYVGTTTRCVNHFATTAIFKECLAGVVGIEPTPKVLETFVLPLNYTPMLLV